MVGKAGVWAHFGSWDFNRASMYQSVNALNSVEGIELLKNKFNLSEETASEYYYQIKTTEADRWIAPWPNYVSNVGSCNTQNKTVICYSNIGGQQIQFDINLENMDTIIPTSQGDITPTSIIYANNLTIKEKKFDAPQFPYSIALIPEGNTFKNIVMLPELAPSTFTKLFFFKGLHQKCFELYNYEQQVTGGKIYTWKIDWECDNG